MLEPDSPAVNSHPAWRRHAPSLAVLALVLVVHALVNAWWLSQDNLPRMGDDAQHAVFVQGMYDIATESEWSVRGRVRALAQASTGIYPPLFHYASLAGGLVFGPSRAGFAAINTPILWALAIAVYALAALVLRPRYALLAAVTCTALPLIAGPSRLCVTDLLTALWVTLALLALFRSDGFDRRGPAVVFGLALGLGLLTRWMVPLYLAVPVLVALAAGWGQVRAPSLTPDRRRAATRRWARTLAMTAAVAMVLAAPWYAPRVPEMLGVYRDYFRPMDGPSPFHAGSAEPAGSGIAPDTAQPADAPPVLIRDFGAFEVRTWISYGLLLNNKALFLPVSVLTLAGMLIGLFAPRRRGIGFLLVAAAGAYVMLTMFWAVRAPATRYLIPMLPVLAVFPALALQSIPSRRWRGGAVAVFCGWLLFQFVHFSIAPISGVARVDIPLFKEHPIVRFADDHGIVLWSSHVNAGGARIGPPYRGLNWIDRVYEGMGRHETTTLPGNRHQANVMLAGALKPALESVQHDHWPLAHPLRPDSPRVRAMVNPFVPFEPAWPEPAWLDAVSIQGGEEAAVEYGGIDQVWRPLTTIRPHEGFGFQSFPRVRAANMRHGGPGALTAWQYAPQPRPFILIEQADRPRQWPADRIEVADYLVVVAPEGGGYFEDAPDDFLQLDRFEAHIHGYWDERRIAVFARRHARPIALDTLPGMRVEVVTAGDTLAGRWDLPWWRLGRFNAPGIEGFPEAWEVDGEAVVEATFPEPVRLGRIEADTMDAEAQWAYRVNDVWTPLAAGALPDGPADTLRLTLVPVAPGGPCGLRQITLEHAMENDL